MSRDSDHLPRATACPLCNLREATTVCRLCKANKMPIRTSSDEPGYWEEKMREDRHMYREEQALERERVFPRTRP